MRRLITFGILAAISLTACASNPVAKSSHSATPNSTTITSPTPTAKTTSLPPSPTPTSETSPSTSPTPSTDLKTANKDSAHSAGSNHNQAAGAYAYPAADVQRWIQTPLKGSQPKQKIVFLTFDDGPSAHTPKVLEILKAKGVHATFFVIGSQVAANADLIRQEIAEGHAVAIHSYSHNYRLLYPNRIANSKAVVVDWHKADQALKKVLGDNYFSSAYRYPGGHMSWRGMKPADDALADLGAHWIDWNTMTGDAEPPKRSPQTITAAIKMATNSTGQVSVMLAHDSAGKSFTLEALPKIIDSYRARGFTFGIIA